MDEKYDEISDDSFVVLQDREDRRTLNRQIDEAIYNIQKEDYNQDGVLDSDRELEAVGHLRQSSVDGFNPD